MNPLVKVELEHNKMAVDEAIITEEPDNIISPSAPLAVEQPPAEIVGTEVTETNEYYLITGSFKAEGNALRQAAMLREEGFSPEVVIAPNGFYRVSAMMCSDLNTAVIRKDSISKKFPGSWVSRKR
jgi:cell division protein FtsN